MRQHALHGTAVVDMCIWTTWALQAVYNLGMFFGDITVWATPRTDNKPAHSSNNSTTFQDDDASTSSDSGRSHTLCEWKTQ